MWREDDNLNKAEVERYKNMPVAELEQMMKERESLVSEELKRGIPKAFITGRIEFTEEEKKENDIAFEKVLKEYGVLNDD